MFKTNSILSYLILGVVIFTSGSLASVFYSTPIYLLFLCMILLTLFGVSKIDLDSNLIAGAFFSVTVFLFITIIPVIKGNTIEPYLIFLSRVLFVLFLCILLPNKNNLDRYIYNILRVITLLSIISFLYSNVSDYFFTSLNQAELSAETIFFIINRASTVSFLGVELYRSQGVFWEPSLLQLYLNILLIQAFRINDKFWVILVLFAVFVTFSLTGIMLSALIILYFYRKIKINNIIKIIALFSILFFAGYLLYMKLFVSGLVSYNARSLDFTAGSRILLDNYFFGIGFGAEKYIEVMYGYVSDLIYMDEVRGITNSLLYLFVCFGFPAGFVYLIIFIKQRLFLNDKLLTVSVLLVSAASSPLLFMNFYLFIFLSFFLMKKKVIDEKS